MRKEVLAIIGLVLLLLVAAVGTASGAPDTITVDSTTDDMDAAELCDDVDIDDLPGADNVISLREAICAANKNAGSDTIAFNIPITDTGFEVSGITGTWTISLTKSLPILTGGGTIISGTTQAAFVDDGDPNPDGPEIEISGASMSPGHCLVIESAGNVVHGLVINRCPLIGVLIQKAGSDYNTVSGNLIGIDASGSTDLGNGKFGVAIGDGSQGNVVGGNTPEERNVISGNSQYGVYIYGDGTDQNTVSGNYIGTDAMGTQDLGNTETGVAIAYGPQNNTVGGDTEGQRNIISGNGGDGVSISESGTISRTINNTVSGNYIGTVVSGTQALGNTGDGVEIGPGAQNNTVGGDTEGERNVISANRMGVNIVGTDTMTNTVSGNYIGTDAFGSSGLGNAYHGVQIISGAQNNTVGGQTAGEGNVIAGKSDSYGYGVLIAYDGTDGNTVCGNYIGTDATGTPELGHTYDGVRIEDGAQNNVIGPDNIIALNDEDGVGVRGSETISNTITRNSIHGNGQLGIENFDGGNTELKPPDISAASCAVITGTAPLNSTVEVFTGPDGEGKTYLATCSADGAGKWSVTGPFTLDAYVTATATDAAGNTSEFSAATPGACHQVLLPLTVKNY
jgi:hypothetical protein